MVFWDCKWGYLGLYNVFDVFKQKYVEIEF
jgi:hypothetical protein